MSSKRASKKASKKVKQPIRIRFKKLVGGNESIYLDYYWKGERKYEFLNLYLIPERTDADKKANVQTMNVANAVVSKKIVELQNATHGFSIGKSKTDFFDYMLKRAESKSGSTSRIYSNVAIYLKQYCSGKIFIEQIDKKFCNGFIEHLNKSSKLGDNSKALYLKIFNAVLNAAVADDIIDFNPLSKIKPEEKLKWKSSEIEYLLIEEVKALEQTPYGHPTKNAFLFACYTGLRISDVKGLTWSNLQVDENDDMRVSFVQQKTKKREYMPVGKRARQFLPERTDGNNVFALPSFQQINRHLKKWATLAKINKKVTFHVSRHTFATLALSLKVPIETVSKLLGHSDIQTTQIYAKVIDRNKREAIDILDEA